MHKNVGPSLAGGRQVALLPTLLTLLAMLVAACGSSGGPSTSSGQMAPPDKQDFRYAVSAIDDFGSLDPPLIQSATDAYAVQTIFTGLVQFKNDGTLVDQLAASHTVSSDGLTYSFTLKPGLKFSDGTPLTANDVAYSINRAISPATKSPVAGYLKLLKDFDKVNSGKMASAIGDSLIVKDDMHLDIVISKPAAYFLQTLTYPTSYVVNKKLIDKYGDKWTDHLNEGAGDGPFMVSSYNHTKGLDVVPNPNYYGTKPKLQKLQFLFSGDTDTTYKAYLSNQYDYAGVPSANLDEAKTRPDYHETPALVISYLSLNYLSKPFDDINVRKAFSLAIDKDLLVQSVLKGAQTPTNHYVPEGMLGYNKNLKGLDGTTSTKANVNMAKQLLQQSSYGSAAKLPPITFTYYTGSPTVKNVVTALAQQWQDTLGVQVKTTAVDFNKLISLENSTTGNSGPLQLWYLAWQADYTDPQDWLSVFFAKGGDYNQFNFGQNTGANASQQQAIQDQLAQADITQDQNQRVQMYNEAEQKISDQAGWIPLYQNKTHSLINPKLHGFVDTPLGITAPDAWGDVYFTT
ncbi:MAG: peptide ABC transporter substrate-binding protein [Ktedonobacteraceae bacterium]|nr:peptide ABC transporter substrate-binding protein [Ktedonobacteraceae bacterium]